MAWLCWNWRTTIYIKEIGIYVRIDRIPFRYTKVSFSKDKVFDGDYLIYKGSHDYVGMDVYYVPPQTICVSGASDVVQNRFQIIEYKKEFKLHRPAYERWTLGTDIVEEYTDSTFIKNPSYHFDFYGFI